MFTLVHITGVGAVPMTSGFTNGIGQIWFSDVQCHGNETRLTDCTILALGNTNCTHAEDAGVSCLTCTRGSIRFQGGTSSGGRVDICNNNTWGTVCNRLWGTAEAHVVCRQLGFNISSGMYNKSVNNANMCSTGSRGSV